jgi:heme-degrading monooxygenase HmoA
LARQVENTPARQMFGWNPLCAEPLSPSIKLAGIKLMEERMFVAIARFPTIPTEREDELQAWFAWSNDQLREIDGLKGRRLLRDPDGTYMALVEHESAGTFDAMHATEAAARVHARLAEVIIDEPRAKKYQVVVDFAKAEACCGGSGGHGDQGALGRTGVGIGGGLQVAGGCCRGA